MTATLKDRLAELAEGAPTGGAPPDEMWTRGVRRARVRRTAAALAAAACAAVLAVAGIQVGGTLKSSPPTPATGKAEVRLPARFYEPSRWLPGTKDHPIGPVAAIIGNVERGHGGGGFVAVSGTTGEYRFLDLPGDDSLGTGADAARIALSPDGHYIAYWYAGKSTGEPAFRDESATAGVAIYNTVTGKVQRHDLTTAHGLAPRALSWIDDDRLYFVAGQYPAPGANGGDRVADGDWGAVWTASSDNIEQLHLPGNFPRNFGGPAHWTSSVTVGGRIVLAVPGDKALVIDPDRRPLRVTKIKLAKPLPAKDGDLLLSPSGRHAVEQPYIAGKPLLTFATQSAGSSRKVPRSGLLDGQLLGMPDDNHLLVADSERSQLVRVDLRTGNRALVSDFPATDPPPPLAIAADSLTRKSVDRPAPPNPRDPRVKWIVGGASGGVVLVLLGAGLVVRRRYAKR